MMRELEQKFLNNIKCLECDNYLVGCNCLKFKPMISDMSEVPSAVKETLKPKGSPHRCPVCDGRGQVFNGFYPQTDNIVTIGPDLCRTCSGLGLVWG